MQLMGFTEKTFVLISEIYDFQPTCKFLLSVSARSSTETDRGYHHFQSRSCGLPKSSKPDAKR